MQKKRVLILSEGFGSGHTQAGYALAAGMKEIQPNVHTKVIELGSFLNPTVAPWILSAYRLTVSTNPALVGMLYRKQHDKPLKRLTALALHKLFYNHTADVIRQLRPDLIVCTHPIPSAIIGRLKASGLDVPLCTVITDYDAHGSWMNRQVDQFLVSTESVRRTLLKRGVHPNSVNVTGIPVHPTFWTKEDKAVVRRKLKLKNMPTVFIMGGGWGLVANKELFYQLAQWKDRVQLVFCVGNNQKLLTKLKSSPAFSHPNIVVIGQTKEVSKWMDASDLLITKPGGMTCTEAMAKGLPMLFCESIPGQEEKNCEYFVSGGYGEVLSPLVLDRWLHAISIGGTAAAPHGFRMSPYHSAPREVYRPERCAEELVELLNARTAGARPVELRRSLWASM